MTLPSEKAIIHATADDLLVALSPSGHAQVLETNSERGRAATPMELLLIALGSCTAVNVISILRKKRAHVTNYCVEVRGQRRADYPRKFTHMEVHHIVRGRGISEKAVAQAIELSETKYCSVAATLKPGVEIHSTFEIVEETDE